MATDGNIPEKWVASFSKSLNLFVEAGVDTEFLQGPTVSELHK